MRAKLLRVISSNHQISYNYGDDYSDVIRHVVTDHTDWEEVTEIEFNNLENWIKETSKNGNHYLLITDSGVSVRKKIEEMVEAENEVRRKEKKKQEEQKRKRQELEGSKKAKQIERLRKKLEKLRALEKELTNT